MPYDDSQVTVDRSQTQVKELLKRYGVEYFRFTSLPSSAMIEFVRKVDTGQLIPFRITVVPKPRLKVKNTLREAERAERQVWRLVYYWLKSKLEAIDFGLVEFEREFLPYMMLQDDQGHSEEAANLIFARLAGKVASEDDPFGGLRLAGVDSNRQLKEG